MTLRSFPDAVLKLLPIIMTAAIVLASWPVPSQAAGEYAPKLPSSFKETVYATGVYRSSAMAFSPDGRLFVAERRGPEGDTGQFGTLRVIKNGKPLPTPFLKVPVAIAGERGLIGFTFDPSFESNGYVYVYYTYTGSTVTTERGKSRISRFKASKSNPDVAEPGSEVVIMDDITNGMNHNGGMLQFGVDGKLYFGVGDNGGRDSAQSIEFLSGKIHRIDAVNYPNIIPSDNPYVNTPGARQSIWAHGLRNPFTFGVDRATGRILINDVGESAWEWIHELQKGANYGWPKCEGGYVFKGSGPCDAQYTKPLYVYPHPNNPAAPSAPLSGCSIIGGAFYHGSQFPAEYKGSYFFTDFCGPWIARLTPEGKVLPFARDGDQWITHLTVGPDGSLYYLGFVSGKIYKIEYGDGAAGQPATPTPAPTMTAPPAGPSGAPTVEPAKSPTPTPSPTSTPVPAPTPTQEPAPKKNVLPPLQSGGGCNAPERAAAAVPLDVGWVVLGLLPLGLAFAGWRRIRGRGPKP